MTRLIPARETERLASLRNLAILDTATEPHFDAVCRLACSLFGVPIASIAFLDAERQWFKASCGLDYASTPRMISFCARTILLDAPCIVTDAAADPRFARNPLVTGPPGIRFYAGVPLALEPGLRIGTLCLIDLAPRQLSTAQLQDLQDLARIAIAHLRLHEAENRLVDGSRGRTNTYAA